LKEEVRRLSISPTLAVVLVGDDPASLAYIKQKEKASTEIGANLQLLKQDTNITQNALEALIDKLNQDKKITGIIVQKPLSEGIDADEIDVLIDPAKDVDGLNPLSAFVPATTRGIFALLAAYKIKVPGKKVVVVGRSRLVGLPTALEFINQDATVTVCHSKTTDLAKETPQADILISAVGSPGLIKANMVKEGAVVVDVGLSRVMMGEKPTLVGDVAFGEVSKVAGFVTPVPGGVGPMTVAGLLMNLVEAAYKQR